MGWFKSGSEPEVCREKRVMVLDGAVLTVTCKRESGHEAEHGVAFLDEGDWNYLIEWPRGATT